jgi:hypothetical protein
LQDDKAIDWMLGRLEKIQPDVVVHLGDGHEADSASRWPTEYDWDIVDEWDSHNAMLAKIRKAAPKARRVFLPGNHDANFQEICRIDKKLRRACDFRDHEPELKDHWELPASYVYDKRRGTFSIGQVTFAHGYEAGANADEFHAILLAAPFGLYVGGHTHRPTPCVMRAKRTATVPLPYWYANAGAMRNLKPPYMERKRTHNWGQAIVVGEAVPLKSPRMSRHWDARVEIFRMADDGNFD